MMQAMLHCTAISQSTTLASSTPPLLQQMGHTTQTDETKEQPCKGSMPIPEPPAISWIVNPRQVVI